MKNVFQLLCVVAVLSLAACSNSTSNTETTKTDSVAVGSAHVEAVCDTVCADTTK